MYFTVVDPTGNGKFCENYLDNKFAHIQISNPSEGNNGIFENCKQEDAHTSKIYTTYQQVKTTLNLDEPIEDFIEDKKVIIKTESFQKGLCTYYRGIHGQYSNSDLAALKMTINY